MKQHTWVAAIAAVMVLCGFLAESSAISAGEPQTSASEHRFRVGKLNNRWKVYDSKNPQNRVIVAKKGDKVVWSATGSGIFINFTDETLFGTDEASAAEGQEVALTVSPNAKPGRYTYSIFCAKEGKFATGDSPPVIIIQ